MGEFLLLGGDCLGLRNWICEPLRRRSARQQGRSEALGPGRGEACPRPLGKVALLPQGLALGPLWHGLGQAPSLREAQAFGLEAASISKNLGAGPGPSEALRSDAEAKPQAFRPRLGDVEVLGPGPAVERSPWPL